MIEGEFRQSRNFFEVKFELAVETLDARGNLSALNRFDFSVADFACDEGASLSYTVRPRMSPGVGELEGWDPNFSPQVTNL